MFHANGIPNKNTGPDMVYLERLQSSYAEMTALKNQALKDEDFPLAESYRSKITVIRTQLEKMHEQFPTEVLQICLTVWQLDLIDIFAESLSKNLKEDEFNLLESTGHQSFLQLVRKLPPEYFDSFLHAILILFPHDLPDIPKPPYGWEFFAKNIPVTLVRSQDLMEAVKLTTIVAILDVVCVVLSLKPKDLIRKETYDLILRHIFYFVHNSSLKKIGAEIESLFDKAFTRSAITMGYISRGSLGDIFRYVLGLHDASKKLSVEELCLATSLLRYSFYEPKSSNDQIDAIHYISEVMITIEKCKKNQVKIVLIKLLERIIQPHDGTVKESPVLLECVTVYKKAKKWLAQDVLREATLTLMTIILINSKVDFFAQNIDSFLNTELFMKSRNRTSYVYPILLQLLRGIYYQDTLKNYHAATTRTYERGLFYSYGTRPKDEQSPGTVANRLLMISDLIFVKAKTNLKSESFDTVISIVVQMAAQHIGTGIKIITQLLDGSRVENTVEYNYIGLSALRIMIDPDSGFAKHAASRSDPQFEEMYKNVRYDLNKSIINLFRLVHPIICTSAMSAHHLVREFQEILKKEILAIDPDAAVESALKSLKIDDKNSSDNLGEEMPGSPVPGSLTNLRKSRSDLILKGAGSNTNLNRSSVNLTSLPVLDAVETTQIEHERKLEKTLTDWLEAIGVKSIDVSKYSTSSDLTSGTPSQIKFKAGIELYLEIYREILFINEISPTTDFIGGNFFIGSFITHCIGSIATESNRVLQSIFVNFPEFRLGILNGLINFMRADTARNDVSTCTNVLVLARLIKTWANEIESGKYPPADPEGVYRVGCKLDGCMLLTMSYPNFKIRATCLQIIFNFIQIENAYIPEDKKQGGGLALAEILIKSEISIVKSAMYGFLETNDGRKALTTSTATAFQPITFAEMASSSFTLVFQFYHGELTKRFTTQGRMKAVRNLARYVQKLAVPLFEEGVESPTRETRAYHFSNMMLLMAMAGVPINDVEYPKSAVIPVENLLYGSFRQYLLSFFMLKDHWTGKSLFKTLYFLHRDIYTLFLAELSHTFQEIRHNLDVITNTEFIDNSFFILRYMIQQPQFENILEEEVDAKDLVNMFVDFVTFSSLSTFEDIGFLRSNSVIRMKTAINYCIVAQRLSGCIHNIQKRNARKAKNVTNSMDNIIDANTWTGPQRRHIVTQMKDWYEYIKSPPRVSINSFAGLIVQPDTSETDALRDNFLSKIGLAMEQLMNLGSIFVEPPLPTGLLVWLTQLEAEGYRVFTPEFQYLFEDALGTALASSYGNIGEDPYAFTSAIFEQLIPKLDDGPNTFLFTLNRRLEYAEPFLMALHCLPQHEFESNSARVIYPEISSEDAHRIKRNIGSLLFYGLYNLMSSKSEVRIRSWQFISELLTRFNPSKDDDKVEKLLKTCNGQFYNNVGSFLKEKILVLSSTCSEWFQNDSGSFLWEAVRCSRSISTNTPKHLLISPNLWITELMIPWCQFVNLGTINVDMVNAEFFRFLMERAFEDDDNIANIEACWTETVRSPELGIVNSSVLLDALIAVHGRLPNLQDRVFILVSSIAKHQPDLVTTGLAHLLSSSAFPWNQAANSNLSQMVIKDYVISLHAKFNITYAETENDYRLNCWSASEFSSQILALQFETFDDYLPIVINFILLHMTGSLQDSTIFGLLKGLIFGFISYLYSSNKINTLFYAEVKSHLSKILGWIDMKFSNVVWGPASEIGLNGFTGPDISVFEFTEVLLAIFENNCPKIEVEIVKECLTWASEGFLAHQESIHAIKCFQFYVDKLEKFPIGLLNPLLPRLVDHLSIIAKIELEVSSQPSAPGWEGLPKGKVTLLDESLEAIECLQNLHAVLVKKYYATNTLEKNGLLFWATMGLLNFPGDSFPKIIESAFNLLLDIFTHMKEDALEQDFLQPFDPNQEKDSKVILLMIPHLFSKEPKIQLKALLVLLKCWNVFPHLMAESSRTGHFYTHLYALCVVYSVKTNEECEKALLGPILDELERFLEESEEMAALKPEMTAIKSLVDCSLENCVKLLKTWFDILHKTYQVEYENNILRYLKHIITLSPAFEVIGLYLVQWMCSNIQSAGYDINQYSELRGLLKLVPLIKTTSPEKQNSLIYIFTRIENVPKELDLASRGKKDALTETDMIIGTVRATWDWFYYHLGIGPSNKLFELK